MLDWGPEGLGPDSTLLTESPCGLALVLVPCWASVPTFVKSGGETNLSCVLL